MESDLRSLMVKIGAQIDYINNILTNKGRILSDEDYEKLIKWRESLQRFNNRCSAAISVIIDLQSFCKRN